MFQYYTADGLYLSGNSPLLSTNRYDFYSTIKSVSALFPPFSGFPVKYNVQEDRYINFKLPSNLPQGDYDIIFCNPAGYYKASLSTNFSKIRVVGFIPAFVTSLTGTQIITLSGNTLKSIKKYLSS